MLCVYQYRVKSITFVTVYMPLAISLFLLTLFRIGFFFFFGGGDSHYGPSIIPGKIIIFT